MLLSSIEMSKQAALKKAKELASSAPVVVFSKTYCGYCNRVKQLLTQVGATYKVIELDELSGGYELQSVLGHWTGQSTVPNVFIEGKHIGGCDSVLEKHKNNQLLPLLNDAGAVAINSAQL
ncbi:PREDICTED: glutaredoxin-C1-like [Populus euphratica]|uniref:Glutaredoxin n=1 Tax=Populus euphratica TaxID=75702 RepID=A0AAJ6SZQ0_POPEU|nr:PREDICTED: glutaredoxin-C1-like [Populus euphratica]